MADVTAVTFDEMEPIYDGLARRAPATLGETAFGMQVMTLPPDWDGYPEHRHDATSPTPTRRRSTSRSPDPRRSSPATSPTSCARA